MVGGISFMQYRDMAEYFSAQLPHLLPATSAKTLPCSDGDCHFIRHIQYLYIWLIIIYIAQPLSSIKPYSIKFRNCYQ